MVSAGRTRRSLLCRFCLPGELAELDAFERERIPSFTGSFPISEGARVQWPNGSVRVFAYLKEGPEVELVVKALSQLRIASLVYAGRQGRNKNLEAGETVMISETPIG